MLYTLSVIVAPTVFWLFYHRYKDRFRPEPLVDLGLAFLLGIGAGFLAALPEVDVATPTLFHELAYMLLVGGLLEESAKMIPFLAVCRRFRSFDEPIDGIIYASLVAMGFACYENLQYRQWLTEGEMLARSIASPLTHCMWASIWGYAIGRAKIAGSGVARPALISLGIAAIAHGLYNFVLEGLSDYVRPLAAGIVLLIWIWRIRLIERLHQDDAVPPAVDSPR